MTVSSIWPQRLWNRFGQRLSDDRGSLPMAMMVMLIGLTLTAALIPSIINQRRSTTFDTTRVHSLNAAQSGVDAVIGKIRDSVSSGKGDPTKLPCTTDASQNQTLPLTGNVTGGAATYSVTIQYYVSNPTGHPEVPVMRCVPGYGTYDPGSSSVIPRYARITSTGSDNAGGVTADGGSPQRTLTTVYAFQVDNSNISGGAIRVYPNGTTESTIWCIDVGSGTPTAGVTIPKLQQCSTSYPPAPQQVFAYRTDLTLQLTSSIGTIVGGITYTTGLCLDIRDKSSTTPTSGSPLILRQCGALGSPVWSQQWSFDDHSSFQAPTSSSATTATLSNLCMTVTSHTANAQVALATCDGYLISPTDAWIPTPSVGAGAAAAAGSMQWINFQQFGRCINSPGAVTNPPYLIAPGCKQNPKPGGVNWNQKLTFDSNSGWFYYNTGGVKYCLYNQGTGVDTFVLLTVCSANAGNSVPPSRMVWTRSTPATSPSIPFSQQYRFQNGGLCLSLKTVPTNDQFTVWPKLVMATCDYSTLQQWNAVNVTGSFSLQDTSEK